MFIVGLTGGICSGKSTAGDFFRALGVRVIDADKIGHLIIEQQFSPILNYFGPICFNNDGTVNRVELKKIIFSDNQAKLWLEYLIHPLVMKEIEKQVKYSYGEYVVIESAILLQTNIKTNVVLSIVCNKKLQNFRIGYRDNINKKLSNKIIKSQLNQEEIIKKSDDIIHNDYKIEFLENRINKLHLKYMRMANDYRRKIYKK